MTARSVLCTGSLSCNNPVRLPETRCYLHRGSRTTRAPQLNRVAQVEQPTLFNFDTDSVAVTADETAMQLPKSIGALPDRVPRYAVFRGKKVRVLSYDGNNKFTVLDSNDSYRILYRSQLTFLPSTRPSS